MGSAKDFLADSPETHATASFAGSWMTLLEPVTYGSGGAPAASFHPAVIRGAKRPVSNYFLRPILLAPRHPQLKHGTGLLRSRLPTG